MLDKKTEIDLSKHELHDLGVIRFVENLIRTCYSDVPNSEKRGAENWRDRVSSTRREFARNSRLIGWYADALGRDEAQIRNRLLEDGFFPDVL